jgi:hypothetical protein
MMQILEKKEVKERSNKVIPASPEINAKKRRNAREKTGRTKTGDKTEVRQTQHPATPTQAEQPGLATARQEPPTNPPSAMVGY